MCVVLGGEFESVTLRQSASHGSSGSVRLYDQAGLGDRDYAVVVASGIAAEMLFGDTGPKATDRAAAGGLSDMKALEELKGRGVDIAEAHERAFALASEHADVILTVAAMLLARKPLAKMTFAEVGALVAEVGS